MRSRIKILLFALTPVVLTVLERLLGALPNRRARGVFLIPPSPNIGSLGDDAMVVATADVLCESGEPVYVLCNDGDWARRMATYGVSVHSVSVWKIFEFPLTLVRVAIALLRYQPRAVYLIGADVIDGYYSIERSLMRMRILLLASRYCADVRLVGFSLNAEPDPRAVEVLRTVARRLPIMPRDPTSAGRLTELGIPNQATADLAFLLTPRVNAHADEVASLEAAVRRRREEGLRVVAININAFHCAEYGMEFASLMQHACQLLIEDFNCSLIFVGHDERVVGGYTDLGAANACVQALSSFESDLLVPSTGFDAQELKYLAKLCDFVLTGRMHFAIAALGQGVPAVMFAYQGKQEGLAQHFNLAAEEFVLAPDVSEESLGAFFSNFLLHRGETVEQIERSLPRVLELSRRNLSVITR